MKRFERIKRTQLAFDLFCQRKKLRIIGKFLDKFEHRYFDQYMFICLHRPTSCLEYSELLAIRYRNKVAFQNDDTSRLLTDNVHNKLLPEMIDYFNHWLIIMKFPHSYWKEKVLRIEAEKLFTGNKCEWGFSREKWLGNYLVDKKEHHVGYDEYFKLNGLGKIIFAAKIIVGKAKAYGLIMNETSIFKLSLKRKTFYEWIQLNEIEAVSLSTGRDQLIVLHSHDDDDLIFALDSSAKQKSSKTNSKKDWTTTEENNNNKVGEFVTLLWQRIKSLKINFQSDYIEFQSKNKRKIIKPIEWNSPELDQIVLANDGHQPGPMSIMTCNIKSFLRILKSIKDELSSNDKRRSSSSSDDRKHWLRANSFQKISTTNFIFVYE